MNNTVTKFSSYTFSLLCFSSHFSLIWFAPSIFAPSHKTKSADILFCKDTNLIKFEPKSLFPDCPISVSFMCGHARFSPQGSPASALPRLLPPRGLQSWTLESHHFYTIHYKVYESIATVGEIRVWWRADFQSGSRVLKKVF